MFFFRKAVRLNIILLNIIAKYYFAAQAVAFVHFDFCVFLL